MLKQTTKDQKGFTIIEVLIVLAIAGLILLIVFLAVPALQRNTRNTSRKNDVARIGGAATEFVSNNNGTLPAAANATAINTSIGTLSQYDSTSTAYLTFGTGASGGITTVDKVKIVTKAKCGTSGATVAGTSRQMAVQYAVETGGSATVGTPVCTDI